MCLGRLLGKYFLAPVHTHALTKHEEIRRNWEMQRIRRDEIAQKRENK